MRVKLTSGSYFRTSAAGKLEHFSQGDTFFANPKEVEVLSNKIKVLDTAPEAPVAEAPAPVETNNSQKEAPESVPVVGGIIKSIKVPETKKQVSKSADVVFPPEYTVETAEVDVDAKETAPPAKDKPEIKPEVPGKDEAAISKSKNATIDRKAVQSKPKKSKPKSKRFSRAG